MVLRKLHRAVVLFLFSAAWAQNGVGTGVRILLGATDTETAQWNGYVSARGARVTSIEPWRFEGPDAILVNNSWRVSTHAIRLFGNGGQFGITRPLHVANGVIVRLDSANPDVELQVNTEQGNFAIRLADIPYGKM